MRDLIHDTAAFISLMVCLAGSALLLMALAT
jgi:hypothetical protein